MRCTSVQPLSVSDFRQQRQDGRLHLLAVGAGVVQQQGDRPESGLDVAQEGQHHHEHHVVGFALGAEIGMGGSAAEVDAEKPIQALSAAFIALHLRCRMLRRPSVTGTRDGEQGEFIQRHEDPIRWQVGRFFLNAATKAARDAGGAGP